MRAAQKKECPNFQPTALDDAQNFRYVRMPRRMFSDSRYADMRLDAKLAYAFLLDRLPLSVRNGWVNEQGEAFIVFPRSALSKTMGIGERRVSRAFRQLVEKGLVREERRGIGKPNRIYLPEAEFGNAADDTRSPFTEKDVSAADVSRMSGVWSGGGTESPEGKEADGACC